MLSTSRATLRSTANRSRSAVRVGALALLSLLSLAACGGGGDGGTTNPPPAASIGLSASSGTVTVNRGATATVGMILTRTNFTGAATFAASGLPAGVTASFDPTSVSGSTNSATMTLTAGTTAAAGVSTVTVTASGSGVTAASTTVSVTIVVPTITLTAGAGAATVVQGQTTTIPVTITRAGGFADVVAVATTGLPTGVTASALNIAAGATTGTITLTAAGNATVGTSALTLTATGTGVTAQTATVNLTVTAASTPAISLASAPAAVSVQVGAVGTSTITLTRSGGFAGDVAVAVTGAPTGVTATLAPASIAAGSTTSALSLNVGAGAAAGQYNLTVTGTGTGVTAATTTVVLTVTAAPSIAITAAPTSVALTAGATATTVVTLVRTNFAADVALAATNLPTGVTASFAPATLTGTTLTSTLTLTAAANATIGAQQIGVTGSSGSAVLPSTAFVQLTVSAAQSFTLAATAVTAQQGTNGTSTITITRLGGYAGAVTLTASGLPTGVTAAFNPNATTGNTSAMTLTVGAGAATGSSTVTVSATGAGITGTVTTTFNLTVTASGGGGGGNITWTFCSTSRFPTWFAVQNGSGAWTAVTPTGTNTRVYNFTMGATGGVAYAIPNGGTNTGTAVTVQYLTQAEMTGSGASECQNNRATQSLTGTVAGLAAAQTATINVGTGSGSASANGPFTVTSAVTGTSDLIAIRNAINLTTFSLAPDRVVLRRNVNYTTTIPAIDFATEGSAPGTATYTITNLSGETFTQAIATLSTANGSAGSFTSTSTTAASALTVYGLPNSSLVASDQYSVLVGAYSTGSGVATSTRAALLYNNQLANRSVTLGAAAPTLTPSTVAGPYVRLSATGAWAAEYGDAIGLGYTQTTTNANSWTFSMTRGYSGTGSSNWTLTMPDFSGVGGFQNSWGMASASTTWAFNQIGFVNGFNATTGKFDEGAVAKFAARTGSVTP